MTADTIKAVVEAIPADMLGRKYAPPALTIGPDKKFGLPVDNTLGTFVHMYKNTAIGWHSAAIFASQGLYFPVALSGSDHWVFKAYLYCLDPETHYNKHIAEAIIFAHPDMKGMRDVIESLLLCSEIDTVDKVAELTGVSRDSIEAYEKLFFNVLDRRKDYMYLRNTVYPDSRLVEVFDGYANNEDYGMLLKRYGYNFGGKELYYLSGLPSHMLDEIPAAISSGKLESVFMSQGYLLTKLGLGNQSKHTNLVYHAKGLIAAAKQGGQDGNTEGPLSSVSDRLIHSFRSNSIAQARSAVDLRNKKKYATAG